jgi:serine/threonine protein kinase
VERVGRRPEQSGEQLKRVHNYVIETGSRLGEGTFSVVYRAKDTKKGKEVAMKVTESKMIEKMGIQHLFWEELNIIQRLRHPNIVTCFEYFRTPNNCYTVYEYCDGGDLAQMLKGRYFQSKP